MAQKLQVDTAELTIIELLRAQLPDGYGEAVDVDSIADRDFNDDGQLIMRPPSIRVRLGRVAFDTSDPQRLTYAGSVFFDLVCYDKSLRSKQDGRLKSMRLVTAVANEMAGTRLLLPGDVYTQPVELLSVLPIMDEVAVVDQAYAVTVAVTGPSQFDGRNSRWSEVQAR